MFNSDDVQFVSTTKERDFIWVAEYLDGSCFLEYDGKWNDFYNINKNSLVRFGYIGHRNRLFFESDGEFNINGTRLAFTYRDKDKLYKLSGGHYHYNDIIQYKDASSIINFQNAIHGTPPTEIFQYNFGYKINIGNFYFRSICHIPVREYPFFSVRLVSNIDISGHLQIIVNDIVKDEIYLPLQSGVGVELKYKLDGK